MTVSRATVIDPEHMSILGLLLRSMLERRLADPIGRRLAGWIGGDAAVRVGDMCVTLRFERDRVTITREPSPRPVVQVEGTMSALADAALGRNRVRSVLRGQLRVSGSPRAAACLLLMMRA